MFKLSLHWSLEPNGKLWHCIVKDQDNKTVYESGGNDFGNHSPLSDDAESQHIKYLYEKEIVEECTGEFVA